MPAPRLVTYSNMRELKEAKRAGTISAVEYQHRRIEIRRRFTEEILALKKELRDRRIDENQFQHQAEAVKKKYEGE
jgi:hypothetical protein